MKNWDGNRPAGIPLDMADQSKVALLRADNVTKQFPGVRALSQVNLCLHESEVLAVLGENGAGKSTLMKILAGVFPMDAGSMYMSGHEIRIHSVEDALQNGIALIHQELNLASNLDVSANIFLGREPLRYGLLDRDTMHREASRFLEMVGLNVEPDMIVERLPIGQQQMVEIAKALSVNARVLIMDEPTSSLSHKETEQLFQVVNELKSNGVSIVYISHRLSEVKRLADRVTVLRDGCNAGELAGDDITYDNMVRLMVGRDVSQYYQHTPLSPGDPVLEVEDLVVEANPHRKLSFKIHSGEVVGMAGLVGAGRTEVLQTLFGVTPALSGSITVDGQPLECHSPADAIRRGMALAPEDRKRQGLILGMSVRQNTSLASLYYDQRKGLLNHPREKLIAGQMMQRMQIKAPSDTQMVQYLSGGNQQKVVLGKWLARKPRVLLLDEPTRGIDVGAKQEIYRLMEELAREGVAILYVSSELEEILGLADRVLVIHDGAISGELSRQALTEESIMQLATGNPLQTDPQETSQ